MHKTTSISLKMVKRCHFEWKIVVILSVAHLVTTFIFFSAWDKSRVKRDNFQNSTQKMRTFQSQAECKMHVSADHEGRKLNYQCPICSYLFSNQRALKEHAERFHKVKKIENFDRPRKLNYQCAICSYQFLNHSALNEHIAKLHKSENIENQTSLITSNGSRRGFQCPICLDFFKVEMI